MSTWQSRLDDATLSLDAWDITACRAAAAEARALAASWGETAAVAICDLLVQRAALLVAASSIPKAPPTPSGPALFMHTMLRAEIALASGEACDAPVPELAAGCSKDAIIAAALAALAPQAGLAYDMRLIAAVGHVEALARLGRFDEARAEAAAARVDIERELLPGALEWRRLDAATSALGR